MNTLRLVKYKVQPTRGRDGQRMDTTIAHYTGPLVLTHSRYYLHTDHSTYAELVPVEPNTVIPGVTEYWAPIKRNWNPANTVTLDGISTHLTRVTFAMRSPGRPRGRPRKTLPDWL